MADVTDLPTVGERGPETFVAPANGTIIPHGRGTEADLGDVPDADTDWLQLRTGLSWHIWSGLTSRTGVVKTLCGKWTLNRPRPDYPANEATCERCYRIKSRKEEKKQ